MVSMLSGYCVTGMYHRTIDHADSAIHSQGHTPLLIGLLIVIQEILIVIQEILRLVPLVQELYCYKHLSCVFKDNRRV